VAGPESAGAINDIALPLRSCLQQPQVDLRLIAGIAVRVHFQMQIIIFSPGNDGLSRRP
jgi:hypothetical protein